MRIVLTLAVLAVGIAIGAVASSLMAPRTGDPATAAAGRTAAGADQPAQVRWRLASAFTASTPIIGAAIQDLTAAVREMTDGAVQIRFFEPGALVPALEVWDAVSSGSVDAGWATPGFWAGKVPALQLFGSVPFGPAANEYLAWMYYGGGIEIYDQIHAAHNIKGIPCGLMPPEASGWFRNEISTVEELRGLKMRFYALGARVMEKLGVSTQLLAPGDIYPALELGTIDALEYSSPALDRELGFYQVAKHYYFPGWHQQSTFNDLLINLDRWNALSDAHRKVIETACGDSIRRTIAQGEYEQVPALEYLQSRGVTIQVWGPDFLAAFEEAWLEVAEEESARDADFARAWQSLSEFRASYATWSELGYLD